MKQNVLIIVRGSSMTGPVTRFYINLEESEAIRKFSDQYTYGSSEVLAFNDELNILGSDPFLRVAVVN